MELNSLFDDLLLHLLSWFDVATVKQVIARLSKRFLLLSQDGSLLKQLFCQQFVARNDLWLEQSYCKKRKREVQFASWQLSSCDSSRRGFLYQWCLPQLQQLSPAAYSDPNFLSALTTASAKLKRAETIMRPERPVFWGLKKSFYLLRCFPLGEEHDNVDTKECLEQQQQALREFRLSLRSIQVTVATIVGGPSNNVPSWTAVVEVNSGDVELEHPVLVKVDSATEQYFHTLLYRLLPEELADGLAFDVLPWYVDLEEHVHEQQIEIDWQGYPVPYNHSLSTVLYFLPEADDTNVVDPTKDLRCLEGPKAAIFFSDLPKLYRFIPWSGRTWITPPDAMVVDV